MLCVLLAAWAAYANPGVESEHFEEDLVIRPLKDGRIGTRFSFTTTLEDVSPRNPESLDGDDDSQHYTLFPLTLGQILREYAITELHLSLNAGKWNYDTWGMPDEPGVATGGELWAWIADGASTSVDQRWQGLRNALAGLFCASLGAMDEQRTTSPSRTFRPEGSLPDWGHPHHLRHAFLPSEHVCTENLTPFYKLLPCKSFSGIATLLNPHRLFDADWHGMSIHVLWKEGVGIQVRLTFQAVLDPIRNSWNKKRDWSLKSLFGRRIEQSCPISSASQIRVSIPEDQPHLFTPQPSGVDGSYAVFNVSGGEWLFTDVEMRWHNETSFQNRFTDPRTATGKQNSVSALSVQRTLKSVNKYRGSLNVAVTNNRGDDIQTTYLETIPWFVQLFLHTLRIECNGTRRGDLLDDTTYTPPIPHSRPTLYQSTLTVPAGSTVYMTMDVTKAFLRYTEHPPDAQRGWDLPPAVFVPIKAGQKGSDELERIYTPILLVDLATPDFSMPYNVIIMSSTLITFIFGSVFNLLTRKFIVTKVEGNHKTDETGQLESASAGGKD
ncbi:Gpi16 subunit, GPI transamidase component [Thelephora ganbajun]|uniref:Gpi16 subunit, GPI transamidase component n=1 Tax=Thelephora ganbajun TaxID=370292 RepID=A0ACB6ZQ82_THEGA|nr:Gpi16 subunit, GPI transamidase component [Thelephora ganbajun]